MNKKTGITLRNGHCLKKNKNKQNRNIRTAVNSCDLIFLIPQMKVRLGIISWNVIQEATKDQKLPIMSWCTRYQRDSTEIRHVCLPHILRTSVHMMRLAQEDNHSVFVGIVSNTPIKLSFWLKIWNVITCMPVTARQKTDIQIHLDNMLSMYIYTWKWGYSVLKPWYIKHFTYFYYRMHRLSMYIS